MDPKNKTKGKNATAKSKNATKKTPGRPRAAINLPKGKFTFADLAEANQHVSKLTLRKFLASDMYETRNDKPDHSRPRRNSLVILLRDEQREPAHEKGLGRKTFVYQTRESAAKARAKKASNASVDVGTPAAAPAPAPEPTAEVTAPAAEPAMA